MAESPSWKSFKAETASVANKLKELVREGNLRRVVVEHKGSTVAEFPLTVGVVGAVAVPVVAAVGTLVALLKDCTIHVEIAAAAPAGAASPATNAPADVEC